MSDLPFIGLVLLFMCFVLIVHVIVLLDVRNAIDTLTWYLVTNLHEVVYKQRGIIACEDDDLD